MKNDTCPICGKSPNLYAGPERCRGHSFEMCARWLSEERLYGGEERKRKRLLKEEKMRKNETLMKAIAFAARAHEGQIRKDGETPYASHPFRVCLVLEHVFGINDEDMLTAAVLHDTIEDTTKDFDDIEEKFGTRVASWVATLSKDKRMPEKTREEWYFKGLKEAEDEVKLIKLADVYDNLMDSTTAGAEVVAKILGKTDTYLDNFSDSENKDVLRAMELVRELKEETKTYH